MDVKVYTSTTPSPRENEVDRVQSSLMARGVSEFTAKAWAESEVPKDFGCVVYSSTSAYA